MDGNGLIRPNDALNGRKRSETDNALAECRNFALSMNDNENIDEVFEILTTTLTTLNNLFFVNANYRELTVTAKLMSTY